MDASATLDLLLDTCTIVPAPLQRLAAEQAIADGDTSRLATLARRPDAPQDLLEQYAQMGDERVRAAYLTRPGAAVGIERRSTVLAQALAAECDASVVDNALAVFTAKPTKTLATALFAAVRPDRLTPQQAYLLLDKLGTTRPNAPHWGHLRTIGTIGARCGKDLTDHVLERTTCPWIVAGLAPLPVDHQVLRAAAVGSLTAHRYRTPGLANEAAEVMLAAVHARHRSPEQVQDLCAEITRAVPDAGLRPGAFRAFRASGAVQDWDTTPAKAGPAGARLTEMARSPQVDVLIEVAQAALTAPDPYLAGALLVNPHTPEPERARLVELLSRSTTETVSRVAQVHDLLGANPADPALTEVLTTKAPTVTLRRYGWEPFGGPGNARDVVARMWATREDVGAAEVVRVLAMAHLPRDTWPHLPWPLLSELMAGSGQAPLRTWVAGELAALVESDPAAWHVFTVVVDEFEGSMQDLITTCKTVTA